MNIEKAKEEIQQLADKLKAELDALEEFPQEGEWYWTIDPERGVIVSKREESALYDFRESIGWVWETRDEAKQHLDKLQATERVRSYIAKANGDWVADFKNSQQRKATWGYDHFESRLYISSVKFSQVKESWGYIKPELFDQLIKDCGDDILLIMGVE